MPPRPLLLALAAVWAAGCVASAPRVPPPDEIAADPEAVEALRDSLTAAPSAAARRAVAARRLAAAGVTPLADGTFAAGLEVPLVGGFVPGGQPVVRDQLVVVGASLERGAAPAVLEAARVLTARSLWTTSPERTVQFVFWSGSTGDQAGVEGALRLPVWTRGAVRSVVLVGDGAAPLRVGEIPVTAVRAGGPPVALVDRVVAVAESLAAAPVPPDSTGL